MFRFYFLFPVVLISLAVILSPNLGAAETYRYDVVVYGGTSAAVTTAIQVEKMGRTVAIVSPDKHLGGLSSGGLGFTDSGKTATVGGLSREFYRRIYAAYQKDETWKWQKNSDFANIGQGTKAMLHDDKSMWIFEPHVAEAVFDGWVAENRIPVFREVRLDRENGVKTDSKRIVSISSLCGKTFIGKMFVDATYEGDLMAAAGVSYHIGRESNELYGETWNGNQVGILHHAHWFQKPVDPYITPGKPESGLLPGVEDCLPGTRGEGDHRVQAYCFRMCLSDHPDNRVPFPKPEGYDPREYELLVRVFETGWREVFNKFDRIPNRKTDTNNHGPFSTDYIGMSYEYPEASYEKRDEIIRDHVRYQQGLMYFLANDPRVPADIRSKMQAWGLAKDEFTDNGNWPHQIYVREARRMVGEYVTTEHECLAKRRCPRPVGLGSYTLDSHNVRRYPTPQGTVQNEGDIGVSPRGPYGIDFGALVPKREECENLVVPVCLSSSHIAFGSIRMEPVFMILGQSAATIAVIAANEEIRVQDVDYEKLRERLLADGQRLSYEIPEATVSGLDPGKYPGIVIDDPKAEKTGNWEESTSQGRFFGAGYLHDGNTEKGNKKVVYRFAISEPGRYEVRLAYSPYQNRASNVPVLIEHLGGSDIVYLDQTKKPQINGVFQSLGEFEFGKDAIITISNEKTNGHVIADAIQILPAGK